VDADLARKNLQEILDFLKNIPEEEWNQENLQEKVIAHIKEMGQKNGQVLWPLRIALSGLQFSPSPFEILDALGKGRGLERVRKSLEKKKIEK